MVTKEQASSGRLFHLNGCSRVVGPQGGVKETVKEYRVNGMFKTWKTRPEYWHLPIVRGLRGYETLHQDNAGSWHVPDECPLLRTKGAVKSRPGDDREGSVNGCGGVGVCGEVRNTGQG